MLTFGYEILVTYPSWHLNLVMNLVAGNARLETLILPFLSLSHRDLEGAYPTWCLSQPSLQTAFTRLSTEQHLSLLLLFNLSEKGEIPLKIRQHVPCGVKSSHTICALVVSCTRLGFQKSFAGLTVNLSCLLTDL